MTNRRIERRITFRMIFDGYDYGWVCFLADGKSVRLLRYRIRFDPSEMRLGMPVDVSVPVGYAKYTGLIDYNVDNQSNERSVSCQDGVLGRT